jgi:hypothetical protein
VLCYAVLCCACADVVEPVPCDIPVVRPDPEKADPKIGVGLAEWSFDDRFLVTKNGPLRRNAPHHTPHDPSERATLTRSAVGCCCCGLHCALLPLLPLPTRRQYASHCVDMGYVATVFVVGRRAAERHPRRALGPGGPPAGHLHGQ